MKKLLYLVLATCMSITALAECPKPVTLLEQGAQAPCTGFLFTREKEREVRLIVEDYKLLQEELVIKNKKIELTLKELGLSDEIIKKEREKSELWRTAAEKSTLELVKSSEGQGKRDIWMILLGLGLTVGAGYALGQVK